MKNYIGISVEDAAATATRLNDLLANYQVLYINTRGYHWNIVGEKFFELHAKFEVLYTDLQIKIDEIAERILTIGHTPLHSFTEFVHTAELKEHKDVVDGRVAVQNILESFEVLIKKQRSLMSLADGSEDEGTSALMSDYIREQEKLVWMYRAFLS